MGQGVNAFAWNPAVGSGSTAISATTFNSQGGIQNWSIKNQGPSTVWFDFTSGQTPTTGVNGSVALESSGVLQPQGLAPVSFIAAYTTTTGSPGCQIYFRGFNI